MTLSSFPQVLRVDTSAAPEKRDYNVYIGAGLVAAAPGLMRQILPLVKSMIIVTDTQVQGLYADKVAASFSAAEFQIKATLAVPAGEDAKSLPAYQKLAEDILKTKPDRQTAVIALGGGVVGDIAGFAAATVLRGLPFVQMPTTLLAQVDSSVGGKVGINTAQGKNLLGAFYQPAIVMADTDMLATLPPRELKAGYAEIVKAALVWDEKFFAWLEQNHARVLTGDASALAEAIAQSCRIKAAIVAQDPLETTGLRALLNLGHTFGHALEALGGYDGRLLHGEAVAIGLGWATRFSQAQGLLRSADAERILAHLKQAGLMQQPPFTWTPPAVVDAMGNDKKNMNGKRRLVVLDAPGRARLQDNVDTAALTDFLTSLKGQSHA